jgi:hypothetical protein
MRKALEPITIFPKLTSELFWWKINRLFTEASSFFDYKTKVLSAALMACPCHGNNII